MKRLPTANGEPCEYEVGKPDWIECCDCGLTHLVYVEKIEGDKVIIKFYRDDWLTKESKKSKPARKKK